MSRGASAVAAAVLVPLYGEEERAAGSGELGGRAEILKRVLLPFPAAPALFQIIPAVSLVNIIYPYPLFISKNLGSGEVAWAYPQVPSGLIGFPPVLFILYDMGLPVFTRSLYH